MLWQLNKRLLPDPGHAQLLALSNALQTAQCGSVRSQTCNRQAKGLLKVVIIALYVCQTCYPLNKQTR